MRMHVADMVKAFSPPHVIISVAFLLILVWQLHTIRNGWRFARGYEQEWVAGSLISGYGYSFDPDTAWLGPYKDGRAYTPTSWVEPLYTLVIAINMRLFGEYGRFVLTLLNVVWLGASAVLVFSLLKEIWDAQVGVYTAFMFLVLHANRHDVLFYIGNAAMAGFVYCLAIYVLLHSLKHPAPRRIILLGVLIGILNLTHAASIFFAPLAALMILLGMGMRKANAWNYSFVLLGTVLTVLSPWMIRNYHVFNTFVPVRSGLGFQLYIGNPALGGTFAELKQEDARPPWTADNPLHALHLLKDLEYDRALRNYSIEIVREAGGKEYLSLDEAGRDRFFLTQSLSFIRANPLLSLRMMFWKAIVFFGNWGGASIFISMAAMGGGLVFIKDKRVLVFVIMLFSYGVTYMASLPLYYRYRTPIEPVLFALAGAFLGYLHKQIIGQGVFLKEENW